MSRIKKFFRELLRRKVVRLLGAYIAVFWLLAQGFASLFPVLGVPEWVLLAFIVIGVVAIPILAIVSWKYEIVPPQLVRDSEDVAAMNAGLNWARVRHDVRDAGHVMLKWQSDGGTHEKRFFQPVSIGREARNDIELSDTRVSRHHAVLWAESGVWHVRDLDSANGTFIDHSKVAGSSPLPQSCTLRFHAAGPTVDVFVAKSEQTRIG
jgi:hypothetical protein